MKLSEHVSSQAIALPINYKLSSTRVRALARALYIKHQKGLCYHCGKPLDEEPDKSLPIDESRFPKGFFNNKIHLHHNHESQSTIGAVHAYCNAVLWEYHGE